MDGRLQDDEVVVGGDARQRYYDARGYGRPLGGNDVALSRVEAAHLLFRGDLDAVAVPDAAGEERLGFRAFFAYSAHQRDATEFAARFLVYKDLRDRGFYLSPDREQWVATPRPDADFVVYPRGSGPQQGDVLYHVRVVGEREAVAAATLGDVVLAVVDEESEITYFETGHPDVGGSTEYEPPTAVSGDLLADRVLLWDAPASLHERGFYGQPLSDSDPNAKTPSALQLSLVEAAYLAGLGVLDIETGYDAPQAPNGSSYDAIVERGQAVEGERFDRRLGVYAELRARAVVPKTGFKFGADFRTYADVESVTELGHSELLVRVLPPTFSFAPRDLSLDVRLAHGVRKRMTFATADPSDGTDITWLSIGRLTP